MKKTLYFTTQSVQMYEHYSIYLIYTVLSAEGLRPGLHKMRRGIGKRSTNSREKSPNFKKLFLLILWVGTEKK